MAEGGERRLLGPAFRIEDQYSPDRKVRRELRPVARKRTRETHHGGREEEGSLALFPNWRRVESFVAPAAGTGRFSARPQKPWKERRWLRGGGAAAPHDTPAVFIGASPAA